MHEALVQLGDRVAIAKCPFGNTLISHSQEFKGRDVVFLKGSYVQDLRN